MVVQEIDLDDDEQVRAFWEAAREADAFERPYAEFWSLHTATIAYRDRESPFDRQALAAYDNGAVVGTSQLTFPRLDNTHVAFVGLKVRPAHRGRGVGSALLDESLRLVRARDRTTVMIEVNLPLGPPPSNAGSAFFERRGFTRASVDLHRVLDVPVASDHLDSLERDAAPYRAGYRLESFGDRMPDEHLDGYCRIQGAFNTEAPLGDLDLEPEGWDEDRVRGNEDRFERQGRHRRATVAVAESGEMVAMTELVTSDGLSDIAWQSGTLVMPGHRGHRLGMATKVANLRVFQADFPVVRLIHSWNAEENGPMVAINTALGFRPVEYLVEMQRVL